MEPDLVHHHPLQPPLLWTLGPVGIRAVIVSKTREVGLGSPCSPNAPLLPRLFFMTSSERGGLGRCGEVCTRETMLLSRSSTLVRRSLGTMRWTSTRPVSFVTLMFCVTLRLTAKTWASRCNCGSLQSSVNTGRCMTS